MLRGSHGDFITLKCEVPIVFDSCAEGAKHIAIDCNRPQFYLNPQPADTAALHENDLPGNYAQAKVTRMKTNDPGHAREYRRRIESGGSRAQAEMASSLVPLHPKEPGEAILSMLRTINDIVVSKLSPVFGAVPQVQPLAGLFEETWLKSTVV